MSLQIDPRIGTEFAGYRIEALLGRGGMSIVYLAEHLRLGRKVALKLLAPELAENESFRVRFLRESQLAASIDHPNIIPIYDADEADGDLYIAMRYVAGTDLRSLLEGTGALGPARTVALLAQVAGALDAAHDHGLIHRDVKPGNILIAQRGGKEHCYLADFGLTKQTASISGLTGTGQFLGTIDYVAPEQVRGEAVDGRSDQYSLGCVLYECLTGERPFPREGDVAVLWAHVQEPPPSVSERRPELPVGVDGVVRKALAKDPAQRYDSCEELVAAGRAALRIPESATPVAAGPRRHEVALARARTAFGRRLTISAGLLGALAAVLLAAAIATVAVVVLGDGGTQTEAPAAVAVEPNTLVKIDPRTNEVVASIPVGKEPVALEVTEKAIWVVNIDDQTLSRVDRKTEEVQTIAGLQSACDVTEEGTSGHIWVSSCLGRTVSRLNGETGRVEATVDVGRSPQGLVVAGGALWVTNARPSFQPRYNGIEEGVTRVDLATNRTRKFTVGALPWEIDADEGGVWTANYLGNSVSRISLFTSEVTTFAVGDGPVPLAPDDSGVWVGSSIREALWRLDNPFGDVRAIVPVPGGAGTFRGPASISVDDDQVAVWVTVPSSGLVLRYDPLRQQFVKRIRFGADAAPADVDAGGDAVWVTVGSPEVDYRDRRHPDRLVFGRVLP